MPFKFKLAFKERLLKYAKLGTDFKTLLEDNTNGMSILGIKVQAYEIVIN